MQDVINIYTAFKKGRLFIHWLICENLKAFEMWVILAEMFNIFNLKNKCSQDDPPPKKNKKNKKQNKQKNKWVRIHNKNCICNFKYWNIILMKPWPNVYRIKTNVFKRKIGTMKQREFIFNFTHVVFYLHEFHHRKYESIA